MKKQIILLALLLSVAASAFAKEVKKYYDRKVRILGNYTVSVYATKAGYDNSDVATKEFTLGASGEVCDVNQDGTVDVADIATIISKMTGSK